MFTKVHLHSTNETGQGKTLALALQDLFKDDYEQFIVNLEHFNYYRSESLQRTIVPPRVGKRVSINTPLSAKYSISGIYEKPPTRDVPPRNLLITVYEANDPNTLDFLPENQLTRVSKSPKSEKTTKSANLPKHK